MVNHWKYKSLKTWGKLYALKVSKDKLTGFFEKSKTDLSWMASNWQTTKICCVIQTGMKEHQKYIACVLLACHRRCIRLLILNDSWNLSNCKEKNHVCEGLSEFGIVCIVWGMSYTYGFKVKTGVYLAHSLFVAGMKSIKRFSGN